MLEFDELTFLFGGVTALDRVTANLSADIVGLVGPNGAGKTTLLNVVSGFLTPRTGSIRLDGEILLGRSAASRARMGLRRTYQQELVVHDLTALENVLAIADHLAPRQREAQVDQAIELTGMASFAALPGFALNLFQRRVTELAKTLVGSPKLILMDEPAAGLDGTESIELRELVSLIPGATGAKVIIIDHDTDLIAAICHETLVLDFGRVIALGPTRSVLDDPKVRRAYLGED